MSTPAKKPATKPALKAAAPAPTEDEKLKAAEAEEVEKEAEKIEEAEAAGDEKPGDEGEAGEQPAEDDGEKDDDEKSKEAELTAAIKTERARCLLLSQTFAAHPDLLAKHVAAGSSLQAAKADLADVLLAAAKTAPAATGTHPVRFSAAAHAGNDLEAAWASNTNDCRANFAKKEHFFSYVKRHAAK